MMPFRGVAGTTALPNLPGYNAGGHVSLKGVIPRASPQRGSAVMYGNSKDNTPPSKGRPKSQLSFFVSPHDRDRVGARALSSLGFNPAASSHISLKKSLNPEGSGWPKVGDFNPTEHSEAMNALQDQRGKTPGFSLPTQAIVRFRGYFKEELDPECSVDGHRVHEYTVTCYIEDDTFVVKEKAQANSGMWQGVVLKRAPCFSVDGTKLRWRDLRVGDPIVLAGRKVMLTDCDAHSRKLYRKVGISQGEPQSIPSDPFQIKLLQARQVEQDFFEAKEVASRKAQEAIEMKKARFMNYDGMVLRWYAYWDDDRFARGPIRRKFAVLFYMADGTIEMIEQPRFNLPKTALFLSRRKVPRKYDLRNLSQPDPEDDYDETDFSIGKTLYIYDRPYFIYDCDPYTKDYVMARDRLDTFPDPIDIEIREPELAKPTTPPHNGFGSYEDSLRNTKRVMPKVEMKDARYLLELGLEAIRFTAALQTDDPVDRFRQFVINCFPATNEISIFESTHLKSRNTGFVGGTYLGKCKVVKGGQEVGGRLVHPEYLTHEDMKIGSSVDINGAIFDILDTDEHSRHVLEAAKSLEATLSPTSKQTKEE